MNGTTHMTPVRLALLAALVLPCMAHAFTDTEALSMVYEVSPAPAPRPNAPPVKPPVQLTSSCTLSLGKLEDARASKTYAVNIAPMFPRVNATPIGMVSLKSGDTAGWMRSALESTQRYGFRTTLASAGEAPVARQVGVDASLRLAHAWPAGMNLVSQVVMRVTFRTPAGEQTRDYHGMDAKTNWAGGNGEFMTVLNLSMEKVVAELAIDAAQLCDGKPLPASPADL